MTVDPKILEILCCPVSHTPVKKLDDDTLKVLNASIEKGEVQTVDGELVESPLAEGLITEDGKVIYPVVDDVPVMLSDQGIGTLQLNL